MIRHISLVVSSCNLTIPICTSPIFPTHIQYKSKWFKFNHRKRKTNNNGRCVLYRPLINLYTSGIRTKLNKWILTIDPSMSPICAPTHLSGSLHLDMLNNQVVRIKSLVLGIAFGIPIKHQHRYYQKHSPKTIHHYMNYNNHNKPIAVIIHDQSMLDQLQLNNST